MTISVRHYPTLGRATAGACSGRADSRLAWIVLQNHPDQRAVVAHRACGAAR